MRMPRGEIVYKECAFGQRSGLCNPPRCLLKRPRQSEAVVADLMMPHQANGLKHLSVFGGVIMSMVDRCAALSAIRHCGGQATTL